MQSVDVMALIAKRRSWWLSGGVDPASVVAVYQPKGASNLANSYINLANPGTYDATPGTAPTFDTTTGWTFNAGGYLLTGITPSGNSTWSAVCRFSDVPADSGSEPLERWLFGSYSATTHFQIIPNLRTVSGGPGVNYVNNTGTALNKSPKMLSGVLGFAGLACYRNGQPDGSITASNPAASMSAIWINGRPNHLDSRQSQKIQAMVFYSGTLTPTQIAAISSAMSAL